MHFAAFVIPLLVFATIATATTFTNYPFLDDMFAIRKTNLTSTISPSISQWGEVYTVGEWFGAYPCIRNYHNVSNVWCNGGIPQRANLTEHESRIKNALLTYYKLDPATFNSWIVIDYEDWHFTWNLTSALYRNASVEYVLATNPAASNMTPAALENAAATSYKAAVQTFMTATVNTIRSTLPMAKIGAYGYGGQMGFWVNETKVREYNDVELGWFWPHVDLLCPSLYLPYKSNVDVPFARNKLYITGNVAEANRIKAKFVRNRDLIVAPYVWYLYHPGEPHGGQFLDSMDAQLEYAGPLDAGADNVIMWGDGQGIEQQVLAFFAKNKAVFKRDTSRLRVVPRSDLMNRRPDFFRDLPPTKECSL